MDLNATIIGQSIAMIIFVWFCMKFVWPALTSMIEERQAQIAEGLAAAEKGARSLEIAEVKRPRFSTKHVARQEKSLIRRIRGQQA